jgi:GNAT superfamily N-acetyltransferase
MGQEAVSDGTIRILDPADLPLFRDHLRRLDDQARRDRFAMGASDDFIDRYAENAADLASIQIGYFEDGAIRGAAELRPVGHREAEAAFTVEPEYRRRGIGASLFSELIDAAREQRVRRLYMSCLARNRAMQALARKFSAEVVFEAGDVLSIIDERRVLRAPPFATAILEIGPRWFGARSRRNEQRR